VKPTVGISLGCPCGIGPEVIAAALSRPEVKRRLVPVVFGDGPTLARFAELRRLPVVAREDLRPGQPARVELTQLPLSDRRPGRPGKAAGRAQLLYVEAAIAAAQQGTLNALCTAPVSKEQIARSGTPFTGHTELLAERFGVEVLMLMDGPRLRVALATNHVALSRVPRLLTRERLVRQLKLLSKSLTGSLGRKPRIAVCGLNPHAGDGGILGHEEETVIGPAVATAARSGVLCVGPLAADGLFAQVAAKRVPFDAVLAMFHDQGLVAAKTLDFVQTVNVTLGLPLPRTSPDHGTAYDIAGNGVADDTPMREALLKAAALVGT
jgi:4-hydroxythreonine-4-phosphate dehydrogenase